ncbi:xanthine dehydrogenase family protein molybdopterin-binding subunit [Propylenella binzhouense]|uniref:Xanthine dehydrogenase family protein molybdopterin-binding subunit n=1 Tax=Propylenella binzhouense TaxID=2555902 RepID=A0A964T623_9HYPH|nr:xanthine dehydrogenase family protein molybdopterin-binding subunit [Propylenella binzhouense]MYZ49196.1 xanthine dehydrogenase family protein molybdopterin-binding subunit [Propylenella binzhouense]
MAVATAPDRKGIGGSIRRIEDARLLSGRSTFIADIGRPGIWEVAFLRSPVAHANLVHLEKPAGAEDRVFFLADLGAILPIRADSQAPGFRRSDYPAIADGKVRFVGEPIAICLGRTRGEAEDLAQAVLVDYDELPAVADIAQSRNPDLPPIHPGWSENVFLESRVDVGDVDAARAAAALSLTRRYRMNRQAIVSLEGRGVVTYRDERTGELVVYSSTQFPHVIRTALAECLGMKERELRVVAPEVGGSFGVKNNLNPEELALAALTRRTGKALRWVEDRREHLIASAHAREHRYEVTVHADGEGRVLGLEATIEVDAGAYSVWPWTAPMEAGMAIGFLPGPYAITSYRATALTCASNKSPLGPYRGVGRPGACFAIERTMDEIAAALGLDPVEVRLRNYVRPDQFPWKSAGGKTYDIGDYGASARAARDMIRPERVAALRQEHAGSDWRIGIGYATYLEQTAHGTAEWVQRGLPVVFGYEQAEIHMTADGMLVMDVPIQNHGQGLETTLAQVAHDELGIDPAQVVVRHGDTSLAPYGMGTFASRSMVMSGGAVGRACEALAAKIRKIGAHLLQVTEENVRLKDGEVVAAGGASVPLAEIAMAAYLHPERLPDTVEPGLSVIASYRTARDTGAWSYGTHAVLVAVDTGTGLVEILDYAIAHDCGTIVNPMIVDGQMMGGLAQGIGTALYEEMPYSEDGQPLASTFMDYLVPGAPEVPRARIEHLSIPSPITRYGIKGMGEGGAIPPPAAICNAVNDALRPLGAAIDETPLTPDRIIRALMAPQAGEAGA